MVHHHCRKRQLTVLLTIFIWLCLMSGCERSVVSDSSEKEQVEAYQNSSQKEQMEASQNSSQNEQVDVPMTQAGDIQEPAFAFIHPEGDTLETRIYAPEGFVRIPEPEGSLGAFLRSYRMKPDGSPVLLYDGSEKGNQNAHIAVFALPIENEDLQQCADSVMRVYGEYYYQRQEYHKIRFTLGNGFIADFEKWSRGNRISFSDNTLVWKPSQENDASYDSFKKFMRIVFAYSGTMNMEGDSVAIEPEDIEAGDIFIKGGSPGHVVMIVDICENANGEKAFLLAQGYMPAQEFHVIKNPLHEDDPWYYRNEITYPLMTAQYTFDEGSLKRYKE